ncbi:MAG TPA: four helix bundle protein, partial [Terriglobales bacterium]|nr:four helix bundle protein [Terriglobales bacterium]
LSFTSKNAPPLSYGHIGANTKGADTRICLRIVRLCRKLPSTPEGKIIGYQLLRCGTSVGANYRAVCRARSKPEFAAKMGIVIEEADETAFWLELLMSLGVFREAQLMDLLSEANQLVAIFVSSRRTALAPSSSSQDKKKHTTAA